MDNINDSSDEMEVDVSPISNKSIKSGIERMLELGRELLQMSLRLEKKYQNVNEEIIAENRKMMEVKYISDAFLKKKLNNTLSSAARFLAQFSVNPITRHDILIHTSNIKY